MNLQNTIWRNYGFWFRVSLLAVFMWAIAALIISIIVYFSWPYYINGLEIMVFRFLTWLFTLPAIALFGLINAVPFLAAWLVEDLPDRLSAIAPPKNISSFDQSPSVLHQNSYQNVTSKLEDFDDDDLFK